MEIIKFAFYYYFFAMFSVFMISIFIGSENAWRLYDYLIKANPAYWIPKGILYLARKKLLHSKRERFLFGVLFVLGLGCLIWQYYEPINKAIDEGMRFVFIEIYSLSDPKDLFTIVFTTVLSCTFTLALLVSPLSFGKVMLEWFRPGLR